MDITLLKNIFNFINFSSVIIGFIFIIILLLSKKRKHASVVFLLLVILFLSLNNLQIVLIDAKIVQLNFFESNLLIPYYLLIFPSFYAFLTYYLQQEKKQKSYFKFYFAVFLIEIALRVLFYPFYYKKTNAYFIAQYVQIEEIVNLLLSVFLFIKAFLLLFKFSFRYQHLLSYDNIKWLKIFMLLGSFVLLFWVTAIFSNLGNTLDPSIYIYYPMRLSANIILFWLGFQGFFNYNLMTQRISLRKALVQDMNESIKKNKKVPVSLQENTQKQNEAFLEIESYIKEKMNYLNPEFSLDILTQDLKISTTKASNLINQNTDSNFSDYINKLRVETAKSLLISSKYKEYSIEAIGYECGFNSKSTFYVAFKKFTNQTPTAFRNQTIH